MLSIYHIFKKNSTFIFGVGVFFSLGVVTLFMGQGRMGLMGVRLLL